MCGINGFNFPDHHLIDNMNKRLAHRGPDGSSIFVNDQLSLGHRRLSIIDLSSEACQPMLYSSKGKSLRIVFNGEIYNYVEIRDKLKTLGYTFRTSSDTEVILASYIEWGEKCVHQFNGMWSFCIYDEAESICFISRDRLGVKPFYYYLKDNKFVFSSELKGILEHSELAIAEKRNINKDALQLYFSLGYIPAPHTIYNHVYKLEAGHNLVFSLRTCEIISRYKYFDLPIYSGDNNKVAILEEAEEIFTDATRIRMRSDVNVGAFLSGGLDSSAVVGKMREFIDIEKLHTFSIGFDDITLDETKFIHLVKDFFGTRHHHHIYVQDDFESLLPDYSDVFDEPFGDYSGFPSHKVCKMAREEVTVVLSGDGGDEIFGGYPIYNIGYVIERLKNVPSSIRNIMLKASAPVKRFSSHVRKVNELIRLSLVERKCFHSEMFKDSRFKPNVYQNWSVEKMEAALRLADNNLSEALRIYDLLSNTLSDNYLVKVDRSSMANSIEVRSPFLDYRLAIFAQKIGVERKVGFKRNKIFMRELISGLVPNEIIQRNKMGFTPPIHQWIHSTISYKEFDEYLEIIRELDKSLSDFYKGLMFKENKSQMDSYYLIKLAIFGKWYERWILKSPKVNRL